MPGKTRPQQRLIGAPSLRKFLVKSWDDDKFQQLGSCWISLPETLRINTVRQRRKQHPERIVRQYVAPGFLALLLDHRESLRPYFDDCPSPEHHSAFVVLRRAGDGVTHGGESLTDWNPRCRTRRLIRRRGSWFFIHGFISARMDSAFAKNFSIHAARRRQLKFPSQG